MAFDIKKWLKDDMGFSDSELTPEFVATWEPRVPKLEQGYKRQSDYSRSMDELRNKETELAAANTQLQEEMVAWGSMTAEQKAANQQLQTELLASQNEVARLAQQAKDLATRAGIDPNTLPGPGLPPKGEEPKMPANLVTKEDLATVGNQLNAIAEMSLTLPATLAMIANEHQELTGQKLDQRAIIAEIKKRASTRGNQKSLDPEQVWMEQHSIADLRTAAATKAHDAEIHAAEERGRQAARTEQLVPGSHSAATHSRIFNRPDGTARTSVLQRPAPGQTAATAAAAFATGRYRTQTQTPAGNALPNGRPT